MAVALPEVALDGPGAFTTNRLDQRSLTPLVVRWFQPVVIACRGGLRESVGEVGVGGCPDHVVGVVDFHPSGTGRLAGVSDLAGELRMLEEATDRLGLAAGLDVHPHQRMTSVMPRS